MPKVVKKETKVTKRGKAVEEPKKKKRRAKKDPNAPKNPLSAYLLFCEEWREKVRAENPDASFGMKALLCFLLCFVFFLQEKKIIKSPRDYFFSDAFFFIFFFFLGQ